MSEDNKVCVVSFIYSHVQFLTLVWISLCPSGINRSLNRIRQGTHLSARSFYRLALRAHSPRIRSCADCRTLWLGPFDLVRRVVIQFTQAQSYQVRTASNKDQIVCVLVR